MPRAPESRIRHANFLAVGGVTRREPHKFKLHLLTPAHSGTYQPALEGGQVDGAVADGDSERVPRGTVVHLPMLLHPCRRRARLDPAAVHRRRLGSRLLCLAEPQVRRSLSLGVGLWPVGAQQN